MGTEWYNNTNSNLAFYTLIVSRDGQWGHQDREEYKEAERERERRVWRGKKRADKKNLSLSLSLSLYACFLSYLVSVSPLTLTVFLFLSLCMFSLSLSKQALYLVYVSACCVDLAFHVCQKWCSLCFVMLSIIFRVSLFCYRSTTGFPLTKTFKLHRHTQKQDYTRINIGLAIYKGH